MPSDKSSELLFSGTWGKIPIDLGCKIRKEGSDCELLSYTAYISKIPVGRNYLGCNQTTHVFPYSRLLAADSPTIPGLSVLSVLEGPSSAGVSESRGLGYFAPHA